MDAKSIFFPPFALVIFTFLIGLSVFFTRVAVLRRDRVNPQALADGGRWDEILRDAENPSDAFENLFEVPTLFYAATVMVFVTGLADPIYIAAAWMFVVFRIAQGLIHCTYNRIMHRATAYWFGCVVLLAMWVRFAIQLSRT